MAYKRSTRINTNENDTMRKVTQQIKEAWTNRKACTIGNTCTDGETVWLHGNAIVRRDKYNNIEFNVCGWNTVTTRERINGILGVGLHQKDFSLYRSGVACPDSGWQWFKQEEFILVP